MVIEWGPIKLSAADREFIADMRATHADSGFAYSRGRAHSRLSKPHDFDFTKVLERMEKFPLSRYLMSGYGKGSSAVLELSSPEDLDELKLREIARFSMSDFPEHGNAIPEYLSRLLWASDKKCLSLEHLQETDEIIVREGYATEPGQIIFFSTPLPPSQVEVFHYTASEFMQPANFIDEKHKLVRRENRLALNIVKDIFKDAAEDYTGVQVSWLDTQGSIHIVWDKDPLDPDSSIMDDENFNRLIFRIMGTDGSGALENFKGSNRTFLGQFRSQSKKEVLEQKGVLAHELFHVRQRITDLTDEEKDIIFRTRTRLTYPSDERIEEVLNGTCTYLWSEGCSSNSYVESYEIYGLILSLENRRQKALEAKCQANKTDDTKERAKHLEEFQRLYDRTILEIGEVAARMNFQGLFKSLAPNGTIHIEDLRRILAIFFKR